MPVYRQISKARCRLRNLKPRVVAASIKAKHPSPALFTVRSYGRGIQLRGRVQEPRLCRIEKGPCGAYDRLAGLVAGGLWPLRAVVHTHGVAQRRYISYRRWPRRRWSGSATFRTAQQLAGQREPGQSPPADVADQTEVRQE